jgi:GR25 family glycosyltransferase involved in LPS biosynthesis
MSPGFDDFHCYVINLDRTPQRMAVFLGQNADAGLSFRRFAAVDGNAVSEEEALRLNIIKPGTTWQSRATIGVAMSHKTLWEKAVAEQRPLMIFEDDAYIRHDFRSRFTSLVAGMAAWDIVLLGYNTDSIVELRVAGEFDFGGLFSIRAPTVPQLQKFVRVEDPVGLFRLRYAFGICAYAITPAGAEKLLARCFPMDNRLMVFKATGRQFNAYSIDCMMNVFYGELAAYACMGPLVLPHNDWSASTVVRRQR